MPKSGKAHAILKTEREAVPGLTLQLPSALTAILTARRPEAALALTVSTEARNPFT